jgi:hypothetical protein
VWLGKFFVDYTWSIVEQSLVVGFREAFGSWAVVDALNLVWLHAADVAILSFRNNDYIGPNVSICCLSTSLHPVCDKQSPQSSYQPVQLTSTPYSTTRIRMISAPYNIIHHSFYVVSRVVAAIQVLSKKQPLSTGIKSRALFLHTLTALPALSHHLQSFFLQHCSRACSILEILSLPRTPRRFEQNIYCSF